MDFGKAPAGPRTSIEVAFPGKGGVAESQVNATVADEVYFATDCKQPQPASTLVETPRSDPQTME